MSIPPKVQDGPESDPKLVVHCYPWYIADWAQSEKVAGMSLEERGLYRELIDLCTSNGSLPDDPTALQKMARCTEREFRRAWPKVRQCFNADAIGRLHNNRVDRVLSEIRKSRGKRSNAGTKGAIKRWQSDSQHDGNAIDGDMAMRRHTHSHPPSPSLSHSHSLEPDAFAMALSDRHPKKGDRTAVEHAIVEILIQAGDAKGDVLGKIEANHAAWMERWVETNIRFVPRLSNWLRDGGWRDAPPQPDLGDPGPELGLIDGVCG